MAVCPECKNVINELIEVCSGLTKLKVKAVKGGWVEAVKGKEEYSEFESDGTYLEYCCPDCSAELFNDGEDAADFLLRKNKLKELIAKKNGLSNSV